MPVIIQRESSIARGDRNNDEDVREERPSLKEVVEEEKPQLPKPCGYKILIALPEVEETTEGGNIKPDIVRELEEYSYSGGLCVEVRGQTVTTRRQIRARSFPTGAYCKEGDFIFCFELFREPASVSTVRSSVSLTTTMLRLLWKTHAALRGLRNGLK